MIVVLLLVVRVAKSSVISRPNRRLDNTSVMAGQNSSTVHNATMDCADWFVLNKNAWQCLWDLEQLAWNGYPWSHRGKKRNSRHHANATDRNNTLRDALDSLNHVCHTYDRSQTCLEESGIRDYCLGTTNQASVGMYIDSQFICHHQQRDENLVRSMQCLYDSRLLAMLYFHIADRCRGMGILDDIMRRNKNALFYIMDIKPIAEQLRQQLLYLCIPRSVISTCIIGIIEDHCGTMTADLVQNYLLYYQDWYGKALQSAGLNSDICDSDISSGIVPSWLPILSGHAKLSFSRLLEITAPGTALDTVNGKGLLAYVQSLSGKDLCTTPNADSAYTTCMLSADNRYEKSKFNILQFAHLQMAPYYHGTQCSRLEEFTACWNLLQQICGPKVRGLELYATLLVEGCKIQSELDTLGCHWQDMLLPHYINASRVTVWPLNSQCLSDPMYLESRYYSSLNDVIDNLDTVISLLQPGVEEISRKCGSHPASRLRSLFHKLHYLQRDAIKYRNLFDKSRMPH